MKFTLNIDSDNDGMQTPEDVALVLRKVAARIREDDFEDTTERVVRDINGQRVGMWVMTINATNYPKDSLAMEPSNAAMPQGGMFKTSTRVSEADWQSIIKGSVYEDVAPDLFTMLATERAQWRHSAWNHLSAAMQRYRIDCEKVRMIKEHTPEPPKPEKMYLVCEDCGEVFDDIDVANQHVGDDCDRVFSIRPESQAL